ncbi:cell division protein ZapB [Paraferrimonas sp. SM1919]|uniref:cell division protein ZapB n=1 Tax=Paraferrimonas sp. SM1919 TaxID=2662263 RepID=UPI0013D37F5E|nr:cell division protein ZapB [Paraferrimonas sp. SM1919]
MSLELLSQLETKIQAALDTIELQKMELEEERRQNEQLRLQNQALQTESQTINAELQQFKDSIGLLVTRMNEEVKDAL